MCANAAVNSTIQRGKGGRRRNLRKQTRKLYIQNSIHTDRFGRGRRGIEIQKHVTMHTRGSARESKRKSRRSSVRYVAFVLFFLRLYRSFLLLLSLLFSWILARYVRMPSFVMHACWLLLRRVLHVSRIPTTTAANSSIHVPTRRLLPTLTLGACLPLPFSIVLLLTFDSFRPLPPPPTHRTPSITPLSRTHLSISC